jgi:hypothetical protein
MGYIWGMLEWLGETSPRVPILDANVIDTLLGLISVPLEVTEASDQRLVTRGERWHVLDRVAHTVARDEDVIAGFDDIVCVNVRSRLGRHGWTWWCVSLGLGPFSQMNLGCCREEADAMALAAQISRVINKPVVL